jgi:hypothetical protein
MKINTILIIFIIIIGCVIAAGYVARSYTLTPTGQSILPNTSPVKVVDSNKIVPVANGTAPSGPGMGKMRISFGEYDAQLPITVDNIPSGTVSKGKPIDLTLAEGSHTVKTCSDSVCETIPVYINAGISTTIDFSERLKTDLPQGTLIVDIGNYNANLPVYIDDLMTGNVSKGKPLSQQVISGNRTVKVCTGYKCLNSTVHISPSNKTTVNFEGRLQSEGGNGDLIVSIGGYNAALPVYIDNTSVGIASQGTPLTIKTSYGVHTVKVCSGVVCEQEQIEVKFGKQSFIDFGERLQLNAEFPNPTVRILDSSTVGNTLVVNLEFINPSKTDLTMTATVSCVYSYIDSHENRRNDAARGTFSRPIKAGKRGTYSVTMSMPGGSDTMASTPVIIDVTTV